MNLVKEIFSLSKHDLLYVIIGIALVIIAIKKLYKPIKEVLKMRKEFYTNIDKKFTEIKNSVTKTEKSFNIIFEILLNNMIDEYKGKQKTHFADEKFARLLKKYEECGDGNYDSIIKQWEAIDFE